MASGNPKTVHYKRSHFATQLPVEHLYSPSHAWIAPVGEGVWRAGLTRFATRMLGEMVDLGFEATPGDAVEPGRIIGWIEGFKAISDLFCIASGEFLRSNPELKVQITLISREPYGAGWLYEIRGTPDPKCIDVHGYVALLDKTIDRLMEKQKSAEPG